MAAMTVGNSPNSKGFRTNSVQKNGESEGESESDDPLIVWRGLTARDMERIEKGKGLKASKKPSGAELYADREIHEHVAKGSDPKHTCNLMSATRSKKVPARYAADKLKPEHPNATCRMAKNQLNDTIERIDLTDDGELEKTKLSGSGIQFARNSQEVIICSDIPRDNIVGLYRVTAELYSKARKSKFQDFITFRAYQSGKHRSYGIDQLKL